MKRLLSNIKYFFIGLWFVIKNWFKRTPEVEPTVDPRWVAGPYPYMDPNLKALFKMARKLEKQFIKTNPKATVRRARILKKAKSVNKRIERILGMPK